MWVVFSLALEWKREEVLALIILTEVLAHTMIAARACFLSDVILYTELNSLHAAAAHGHTTSKCICSVGL